MNKQALDREKYLRSKSALNNPAQIQNILGNTDFIDVQNNQPNTYNNYIRNVVKQDELLRKMKESNGGMLSKEIALKKKQEDINNLSHLNKYNNDMVNLAYKSQRKAMGGYKDGSLNQDDPFNSLLRDPTVFPKDDVLQNQNLDQDQNAMNGLNLMSKALMKPHSPGSGLENIGLMDPIMPEENHERLSIMPNIDPISAAMRPNTMLSPLLKKNSISSPQIKNVHLNLNHSPYLPPPPYQQPPPIYQHSPPIYQQPPPIYQQPPPYQPPPYQSQPPSIINVMPNPYPPKSSHSRSDGSGKLPEEVRVMIAKQNELLQNFIEKVEKTGTLETKEDYSEKYEQKIRELEKNFELSQEIMNLRKQMSNFNSEKSGKEEKKMRKKLIFLLI